MLFDPVQNGICSLRHFGRGAQIEHHAVHGRLVQDVGRAQLHCHRIADLLCGQGRLNGVGNDPGWQGRETGGLQNRVYQMGIQPQLLALLRLADQLLAQIDIELVAMQGCRCLHQLLLAAAVFHHVHEGGHCAFRCAVGREARLGKEFAPLLRRVFTRPVGEDIETARSGMLLQMGDKMACQRRARCRERGGVDDQDGVDAIFLQHAVQCLLIGGDGRIAADVERRTSQLAAPLQQYIHCHISQPATVGDDGKPLPLEGHGVAEGFDRGKQFVGIPYPQHASTADGGIIDIVETVGRFVAPAFQYQDRLVARGCPRRREKVAGVVQLVHIDQDGAGDAIAGELIQQLAEVDVAVITKGDEGGKAQFMLLGPIQNGGADGGGLRQKGDLPRLGGNG